MSNSRIAPYGTWISPITAEAVSKQGSATGIEDVLLDPVTAKVYFAQKRPTEGGRSAIVDAEDGKDLFDQHWDARTQVYEYGGAAAIIYAGILCFSNIHDGRVYECEKGVQPTAITPVNPTLRYADFAVHPENQVLIVCITEDHTDPHPARVVTRLSLINASKSTVTTLVEGADFYSCPRFSPDGKFIVWQQWHHPDMPFQSAEVVMASCSLSKDIRSLELGPHIHIAGKHGVISALDPGWASNNTLYFFSDISGYHNPWKFTFDPSDPANSGSASPVLPVPISEEFGAPQWWLSKHGSGALSSTKVASLSFRHAQSTLYVCDLPSGDHIEVPTPYAHIQFIHGDAKGRVVMLGQPADAHEVVSELFLDEHGNPVLRQLFPPEGTPSTSLAPLPFVSVGQALALTLPSDDRTCHVTFYPPKNPDYDGGLAGEKPPVVVLIHGGPFHMEPAALDWSKQFFTSRGWAHIDVNYGGSSGFGRQYRESLHAKWGILDVDDAYQSVLKLDELGLVDSKRAVVHGGSAGGYTSLQIATSLATAFAAGAPQYGISDMRKLDEVLHKFEYYLCDRLMGGKYEDRTDVWHERSPIYHVDKIKMPLLVLQGAKDTVVPADQMINMVKTIKDAGRKAELVLFPDEGHGWRHAKSVQTALEKELAFFNEVLGLKNKA